MDSIDFENLLNHFVQIATKTAQSTRMFYKKTLQKLDNEYLLTVSEDQINQALNRFVTKNVKAILDFRAQLHQDGFRLHCTVNVFGIYAQVAGNFGLVQVQIDKDRQRFVFAQYGFTEVLELHCDSFWKSLAVKTAIWGFQRGLKKDPLGLILERLKLAYQKENLIYLSIHRWLKNNKKIMNTLKKVQVNYGTLQDQQMILFTQVNFGALLQGSAGQDLITEADNPDRKNDKNDKQKTPSQTEDP